MTKNDNPLLPVGTRVTLTGTIVKVDDDDQPYRVKFDAGADLWMSRDVVTPISDEPDDLLTGESMPPKWVPNSPDPEIIWDAIRALRFDFEALITARLDALHDTVQDLAADLSAARERIAMLEGKQHDSPPGWISPDRLVVTDEIVEGACGAYWTHAATLNSQSAMRAALDAAFAIVRGEGEAMTTDPATRHGIERELLERVARLEAEVQQLKAELERMTQPDPLRRSFSGCKAIDRA